VRAANQSIVLSGRQRGFTLIELMVAITVGLFLIGALLTIEQTNHTAFVNQNQLAQLQDSERMAMSIVSDVVQSAGYFPDPTTNTAIGMFPIDAGNGFAAFQTITGTYNAAVPGDTISVRYQTSGGDGILNCSGSSNPGAAAPPAPYVNTFAVGAGQLTCTMNGVVYNLVNGVTNLSVVYGVNTSGAGNNVDTYKNAGQMTAADWTNIMSVTVQLTFNNPLYVAGQGQPQFMVIQRVITSMKDAGPKV